MSIETLEQRTGLIQGFFSGLCDNEKNFNNLKGSKLCKARDRLSDAISRKNKGTWLCSIAEVASSSVEHNVLYVILLETEGNTGYTELYNVTWDVNGVSAFNQCAGNET